MYESCVTHELYAGGGYLADHAQQPGVVIGAFTSAQAAAMWGLKCIKSLKEQPW
jgi:hypothetical protein